MARSFTSSVDPDDLVAESFARVYLAIRNGGGPSDSFRPYLLTTLRNTARTWGRKSRESATDSIEDYIEDADPDPILMGLANRELIQRTFSSLPTRWQEALWWSEVEGRSTSEIAKLSGLSDNAAAALCYRAREGLRQAWIQTQVPTEAVEPECRWTLTRIGAFVRSGLRANQASRVQEHIDDCRRCAGIAARAARIGATLGIALVGTSSAGVALAAVLGTGAGGAAVAPTGLTKLKNLTMSNPTIGIAAAATALVLALPAIAVAGVWGAATTEAADSGAVAALVEPALTPATVSVPARPQVESKPEVTPESEHPTVEPVLPTAPVTTQTDNSTKTDIPTKKTSKEKPATRPSAAPEPTTPVATVPAPSPTASSISDPVTPSPEATDPVPTAPAPSGGATVAPPSSTVEPSPTVTPPSSTVEPSPTVTPPSSTAEPSPTATPPSSTAEPSPTVTPPSSTAEPSPTVTPPPSSPPPTDQEPGDGDGDGDGSGCHRPGHHWWGCGKGDRGSGDGPSVPDPPAAKEPETAVVDGS